MNNEMLESLRLKIDQIDEKMLDLLSKRLAIVSQIGALKKEFDLPVVDLERKRMAKIRRLEIAREVGLSEEQAGELFEFLHEYRWKRNTTATCVMTRPIARFDLTFLLTDLTEKVLVHI